MARYLTVVVAMVCWSISAWAGIVRGTVLSSEDEAPLTGAEVTAQIDSVSQLTAKTGNRGEFSIGLPATARSCTLSVTCPGYITQTLTIANPAADTDLGPLLLSPQAETLGEVSVTASSSRVIALPDKSIVFPTDLERQRATNPLNLLEQISYAAPALSVDAHAGTVTVDGRAPQILVNGRKRTSKELSTLDPLDILKVEYITYPDIRYGAPYLNVVTARNPTGGALMAEAALPVTAREESHSLYASLRRGIHEVALSYRGLFRDSRREHAGQTDEYFAPERTYISELAALPSRLMDRNNTAAVEYSMTGGPRKVLSTTLSLGCHSQDRHLRQLSEGLGDDFLRSTDYGSKTLTPGLEIYGSLPVARDGRLEATLSGTLASEDLSRLMEQTGGYSDLTLIDSHSRAFGGMVYYSHSFSWSRLTAALSHSMTQARNRYSVEGETSRQTLRRTATSAAASLSGQIGGAFHYHASAGLTHNRVEVGETAPFAELSLRRGLGKFRLNYELAVSSRPQSLSYYNDMVLPVNPLLYRKGNPDLRDPLSVRNALSVIFSREKVATRLRVYLTNGRNTPVTICRYVDAPDDPLRGKFLETSENSRRDTELDASLTVGLYNILGKLSMQASLSYADMSCVASDHRWGRRYLSAGAYGSVYLGPWQLGFWANPFPDYTLYGNFLWRNATSWGVRASWHRGSWTFACELADLFGRRANFQEKTTMAVGSITHSQSWNADRNNWIQLSVRYQIDFGRQARRPQRSVAGNAKIDSGVNASY